MMRGCSCSDRSLPASDCFATGPGLVFRRSDASHEPYKLTVNVALTWAVPVYPEYVTTMEYVSCMVIVPELAVQL